MNLRTVLASVGLAMALSACTLLLPASASAQANYTWSGGGGSSNVEWSDAANWGGAAPSGTVGTLSFPASACTSTSSSFCQSDDDVSGLTASTLSIVTPTTDTSPALNWLLTDTNNYPLTLTSGLSDALESQGDLNSNPPSISIPIQLGGPNTWTIDGDSPTLTSNVSASSTTDSLTIKLSNDGQLQLEGASNEAGPVTIESSDGSGSLALGRTANAPGDLNGFNQQPVTLDGATLDGVGNVGALTTTPGAGSRIMPGIFGSSPTGSLQTYGATLDSSALVTIDIPDTSSNPGGGSANSELTAPFQTVSLGNSELEIETLDGSGDCLSAPPVGTTYTLVSAGTVSGTFGGVPNGGTIADDCNPNITYTINYNTTIQPETVTATVATSPPTQTTTSLAASPQSSATNQNVTLTATVSRNSGSTLPTGTVEFQNNGTAIAGCSSEPLNLSGHATCQTSFAASSSPESLTATYAPSSGSDFAPSTSSPPDSLTVGKGSTTTAFSTSSTSPSENQGVTYTATVSPQYSGSVAPSGSVAFSDNGSPISGCSSQPLSSTGTATCTTSYASAGSHSVAASYGGDGNFSGSSSSGQTVAVQATPPPVTGVEKIKVSGVSAKVTLSCNGTSGSSCTDTLELTVVETIKHGEVTAVAARRKQVVIRSITVTLSAGQTMTVAVSLNGTGRRLLARFRTLKAKLKVTQSGTTVTTRTVKFKKRR